MNPGLYSSSEVQIPVMLLWEGLGTAGEGKQYCIWLHLPEIPTLVVVWWSLQWCGVNSEHGAAYKESQSCLRIYWLWVHWADWWQASPALYPALTQLEKPTISAAPVECKLGFALVGSWGYSQVFTCFLKVLVLNPRLPHLMAVIFKGCLVVFFNIKVLKKLFKHCVLNLSISEVFWTSTILRNCPGFFHFLWRLFFLLEEAFSLCSPHPPSCVFKWPSVELEIHLASAIS